jgi:hypothetical protein
MVQLAANPSGVRPAFFDAAAAIMKSRLKSEYSLKSAPALTEADSTGLSVSEKVLRGSANVVDEMMLPHRIPEGARL